jgi:NAD(P)-dependent dehydrogenase (short-subunit alcohol dehydrogenase family)
VAAVGKWQGKVSLVTGGASGIGAAIVGQLAGAGASVVVADIDIDGMARLEAEFGSAVATVRTDVRLEADVKSAVVMALRVFGRLDDAFLVAGGARSGLLVDSTEDDWDFTVDLCLKGVFFGIKHVGLAMIEQAKGGAVIVVSSLNSEVPAVSVGPYCAAKAGATMLAKVSALELAEFGIRVNSISPGLTITPLVEDLLKAPAVAEALTARIPLGRPAQPRDIAAAACFLASEDAAYITGVNLFVDGGWRESAYPNLLKVLSGSASAEIPSGGCT